MKRTLLAFALACLLSVLAHSQEGMISLPPVLTNSFGQPLAGVNVSVCGQLATTAASVAGNIATFTVSSTTGFVAGTTLHVSGFTGADIYFNTSGAIVGLTSTTISISLQAANASATSNGSLYAVGNSTTACAPLSTVYTDSTGTITTSNPSATDGVGHVLGWVAPGLYELQTYGSTIATTVNLFSVGCVPSATTVTCGVYLNGANAWTGNETHTGTENFTGGPANFYVSATGSDSNDCQAATVTGGHGPCLTIQHTFAVSLSFIQPTCPVINIGAGTFKEQFINGPFYCGNGLAQGGIDSAIILNGAGSTTILDAVSSCGGLVVSGSGANIFIENMTLQNTGSCSGSAALFVQNNGYVFGGAGLTFGAAPQGIHAEANGVAQLFNNFTIASGSSAQSFYAITTGGGILVDGLTATCSGTIAYSTAFALVQNGGWLYSTTSTFSSCGSVTGSRFNISGGKVTSTAGSPAWKFFPGNSDGSISQGGIFNPTPTTTLGTCTNGALNASSSDTFMRVQFSGASSACTINLSRTLLTIPWCTASSTNAAVVTLGTVTTSAVTFNGTWANTDNLFVNCNGPNM